MCFLTNQQLEIYLSLELFELYDLLQHPFIINKNNAPIVHDLKTLSIIVYLVISYLGV